LAAATHQDADLISPGHPLFAAIAERLDAQLNEQIHGQLYFDADAQEPTASTFFEVQMVKQGLVGVVLLIVRLQKQPLENSHWYPQIVSMI